jgi:hypothetical protein
MHSLEEKMITMISILEFVALMFIAGMIMELGAQFIRKYLLIGG